MNTGLLEEWPFLNVRGKPGVFLNLGCDRTHEVQCLPFASFFMRCDHWHTSMAGRITLKQWLRHQTCLSEEVQLSGLTTDRCDQYSAGGIHYSELPHFCQNSWQWGLPVGLLDSLKIVIVTLYNWFPKLWLDCVCAQICYLWTRVRPFTNQTGLTSLEQRWNAAKRRSVSSTCPPSPSSNWV